MMGSQNHCGLSYITVDEAINKILELGSNTLMAKIDIKSAFRLLPVHPADRHLLALEGPSTSITFLAIVIDTSKSEIRLPDEKLHRIRQEIANWLGRNKATKREILSLVGLLQHATKVRKIIHLPDVCNSSQGEGT